ncbi:hypothetical protein [Lacticaseibacillus saniviri]|uniref:hypothetical protein n=1 Tax=Lacticaseibacillus saniviri TaxID=931533 RepID=UPI000AD9E953|nr:hypothetical protein [Lacticaseibacillus saniviri]
MLDNTARQLQPEEEALVQQPEPQPKPQVTAAPAAAPLAVPFSAFEKGLALLAGVLAVAVSIFCLFSQNQLANTQRQYEDVQSAITTQTQKSTITSSRLVNFQILSGYPPLPKNMA